MFQTFEHKADMGVRGFGKTMPGAFSECAKAMFSVMADLKTIKPKKSISFKVSATDAEQLLIKFLNELLYLKDTREMLFSEFKVSKIYHSKEVWFLEGIAKGDKTNSKLHSFKTEVKAATYSGLKIFKQKGKFIVQCIVDV
jgi:SHS2 domain-containing protein